LMMGVRIIRRGHGMGVRYKKKMQRQVAMKRNLQLGSSWGVFTSIQVYVLVLPD